MHGETDLRILIASMKPSLGELPYVFCSVDQATFDALPFMPLGMFHEREGISIIVTQQQAGDSGLAFDASWACITLEIHSSLSAVGFLAVVTTHLARAGISVNPISAFYHDHLFVPWAKKEGALQALIALSRSR
jgi:uncharacterized protein